MTPKTGTSHGHREDLMKVAIITPYYRESPDILMQCHESVLSQTHSCTHYLVADGYPQTFVDALDAMHIRLPKAHADNGNTPRAIGSLSAINQGFDAIAYLDADNWYSPAHIESLVDMHRQTGAVVCVSGRSIHRMDGSMLMESDAGDGDDYFDTSCLLLTRKAFSLTPFWALMPRLLSPVCDRIFWQAIRRKGYRWRCTERATVAFRSQYIDHYVQKNEVPPPGAKGDMMKEMAQRWNGLSEEERKLYCDQMDLKLQIGNMN